MGGKCQPECVLAPYFLPDQPQKFVNVHKVFGASNMTKLLNELHPHQPEDAMNSLAYEADMRLRDPVHGYVGIISLLQHQLSQLQMNLTCAKSELSKYQSRPYNCSSSPPPECRNQSHQQRRRRRSRGRQGPPPRRGPPPVLPKGSGGSSGSGSHSRSTNDQGYF